MTKVNDLVPNDNNLFSKSQQRVNIGVDGGAADGSFDVSSITPFCHVHLLSGVFHDPVQTVGNTSNLAGKSGVIRYTDGITQTAVASKRRLQFSPDGGLNFDNIALDLTDVTLGHAYFNDHQIILDNSIGSVLINDSANTGYSLALQRRSNGPHILFDNSQDNVPAALISPEGSYWYQNFSQPQVTVTDNRAMGLSTFAYVGNSGIVAINPASGTGFFKANNTPITISTTAHTFTNINFSVTIIPDKNYGTSTNGIVVFSQGYYRVHYNVAVEKTGGTSARNYACRVDQNGNVITAVGVSYGVTASLALPRTSISNSFCVNLNPGNYLGVQIGFDGDWNVAQTAQTIPSGTWIIIEKLGPVRS